MGLKQKSGTYPTPRILKMAFFFQSDTIVTLPCRYLISGDDAHVQSSPGIPVKFEVVLGFCRYIYACSLDLYEME